MNKPNAIVIAMWPRPAIPAIIAVDSLPCTVRMPCQTIMPEVMSTPTLYTQKNHVNSLPDRDTLNSFSNTKKINDMTNPSTSKCVCVTPSCVNWPSGKSFARVNSR